MTLFDKAKLFFDGEYVNFSIEELTKMRETYLRITDQNRNKDDDDKCSEEDYLVACCSFRLECLA